jgi:hypothetical protein
MADVEKFLVSGDVKNPVDFCSKVVDTHLVETAPRSEMEIYVSK